jgi:hypothetical protein
LIEAKCGWRDRPRVVDVVDGQHLDCAVVVQQVVEPLRTEHERGHDLVRADRLVRAGDDAALDEVHDAVGQQFGVDAEVAPIVQCAHQRVGDPADADLQGRPWREAVEDRLRDRDVAVVGGPRWHLDERPVVSVQPTICESWI